jgi:hypothetical protein
MLQGNEIMEKFRLAIRKYENHFHLRRPPMKYWNEYDILAPLVSNLREEFGEGWVHLEGRGIENHPFDLVIKDPYRTEVNDPHNLVAEFKWLKPGDINDEPLTRDIEWMEKQKKGKGTDLAAMIIVDSRNAGSKSLSDIERRAEEVGCYYFKINVQNP